TRIIRNDIGFDTSFQNPNITGGLTQDWIGGKFHASDFLKQVEQLEDSGLPHMGIGGMRSLSTCHDLNAQRALRPHRETVFGRFAVNEVKRARWGLVGRDGARAV